MKFFSLRIGLFFTLLLLVTNCGVFKNKSKVPFKKPAISENEEIYVPHLKSERKIFFKDSDIENHWVDSIYSQMPLKEKVGQLFMVAAYSNKDTIYTNSIDKLVREYKVGGLILFLRLLLSFRH